MPLIFFFKVALLQLPFGLGVGVRTLVNTIDVGIYDGSSLNLFYMVVMTSPWTRTKMVMKKFKMADLWALLTLISPWERDKCGTFRQILSKFVIHGDNDQPLDKFKNDHDKIQNGRLMGHFDVNFTMLTR